MYKFLIRAPTGHVMEHEMRSDMITIGREAGNDIVLNAPSVSRRHARIYLYEGRCCIEDLGSSNGVYVNGHRINEAVAIDPSCRVDVGGFEVSFAQGPGAGRPAAVRPMTQQPASGARLVAVSGPVKDQVFPLPAMGEATVGRVEGNTIVVPHNSISRNHARLIISPSGITVQDLGSSNGTFVNGERVTQRAVPPGSEVRFGHVDFRLEQPGMPAPMAARGGTSAVTAMGGPMTTQEILKYGIIFLMLVVIILVLAIVLVRMLFVPRADAAAVAPPGLSAPVEPGKPAP